MAAPKICGIETEFGIVARGTDMSPITASSLLVNAYTDRGLGLRAWDFADEHPDRDDEGGWRPEADYPEVEMLMTNAVLTNGSRYYVDHAHPEVSTPECRTPREAVLYDRAAEEIVRESVRRANGRLNGAAEMVVHKNNSDGKGNSYGCHENYLVSRATPFARIVDHLTTHFVTRQIFTGAGKVGTENRRDDEPVVGFQISQRADFFEEPVGLETTVRRPIINTRDEPHCDADVWRRLHVIVGDANMCEHATWLKLGTTAIVLSMIEDDAFPAHLVVSDPVTEIRRVSHDCGLRHEVRLRNGDRMTSTGIQRAIIRSARVWFAASTSDPLGGETPEVLDAWEAVVEDLEVDPVRAADRVDWIAKKRIIDAMAARHDLPVDHPKLRAIDLQYHDTDPTRCLALRVGLRTIVGEDAVRRAVSEPPPDTRAYFRGECIRRYADQIVSANWDSIVFDIGEPELQRVPTRDPLKGTRDRVKAVLDASPDARSLISNLGEGATESVTNDPGW